MLRCTRHRVALAAVWQAALSVASAGRSGLAIQKIAIDRTLRRDGQPSRRRSTLRAGALPPPLGLELRLAPVDAFAGARFSDLYSFHDALHFAHVMPGRHH